ncbi:MAG: hypothetical protein WB791_00665, partial [Waddliaceae bacterium]
VANALTTTKVQDVIDWEKQNLGITLQAKRRQAFRKGKFHPLFFLNNSGQEIGGFSEELLTETG